MSSDPRTKGLLRDILSSIDLIEGYVRGLDFPAFAERQMVMDAVERRFEIIAEAVKALPVDCRDRHPHIPWRGIIAMRNIIVHQYWATEAEVLWKTATEDLGPLRKAILLEQGR